MIIPGDWVPGEVYWKQLLLIALTHLGNLKLPAKHTAFCKTFLRDTKLYPKVSAYIDWYWKWLTWLQILVGACEQNLIISWFFASRFFSWGKKKSSHIQWTKSNVCYCPFALHRCVRTTTLPEQRAAGSCTQGPALIRQLKHHIHLGNAGKVFSVLISFQNPTFSKLHPVTSLTNPLLSCLKRTPVYFRNWFC